MAQHIASCFGTEEAGLYCPDLAFCVSRGRRYAAMLARRQRRAQPSGPARRTPGRIPVGRTNQDGSDGAQAGILHTIRMPARTVQVTATL